MTEFTKGPWELFLTGDERGIYIGIDLFGSSSTVVTTVDCDDLPEAEAQANARLIAAAPELYEALEALLITLEKSGVELDVLSAPTPLIQLLNTEAEELTVEAARAAIAKARGEA